MTTGYPLSSYGAMIEDKVRMTAYHEAMKRHIRPGMVVVEIGAGPGVMAMLACQLGAARVYAIEVDPSIELARRLAERNGFGDRIVCLRKLSTEVDLPEKGDLLISDLRGTLPTLEGHVVAIRDARERLLKTGALQFCQKDRLFVCPARGEKQYEKYTRPWRSNDYGLDLELGWPFVANKVHNVAEVDPVGEPQQWAEIDYRTVESPQVSGVVRFVVAAGERIDSLLAWFEAEVCDGVTYSTAPDQPEQVYGRMWMPLEHPVTTQEGEQVSVELDFRLVSGRYVMRWHTTVGIPGVAPRVRMRQSTFNAKILGSADLARLDPAFAPKPAPRTEAVRFVLERIDGRRSLRELTHALGEAFPADFGKSSEALEFVREIDRRYCPAS